MSDEQTFTSEANTGLSIRYANVADPVTKQPLGGYAIDDQGAETPRFNITWQDGPVNREAGDAPNGAFLEDILVVCQKRLEFYEDSDYSCAENRQAIDGIITAREALQSRRKQRRERGVEGKNAQ